MGTSSTPDPRDERKDSKFRTRIYPKLESEIRIRTSKSLVHFEISSYGISPILYPGMNSNAV